MWVILVWFYVRWDLYCLFWEDHFYRVLCVALVLFIFHEGLIADPVDAPWDLSDPLKADTLR